MQDAVLAKIHPNCCLLIPNIPINNKEELEIQLNNTADANAVMIA